MGGHHNPSKWLLLGLVSARASDELLTGTTPSVTIKHHYETLIRAKQVILKKLPAGFEHLGPAGNDTPSRDRLTTCRGFRTPQSSQMVLLRQAMVPPGHVHR